MAGPLRHALPAIALLLLPLPATPAGKPQPAAVAARSAAPLSDAQLEREIKARFNRSKIRVENFQVRVEGGMAIIEGKTKVIQRKGTATRLARLAGARVVRNRIEVDESARRQAMENLEKGRRRAQVVRGEPRSEARSK